MYRFKYLENYITIWARVCYRWQEAVSMVQKQYRKHHGMRPQISLLTITWTSQHHIITRYITRKRGISKLGRSLLCYLTVLKCQLPTTTNSPPAIAITRLNALLSSPTIQEYSNYSLSMPTCEIGNEWTIYSFGGAPPRPRPNPPRLSKLLVANTLQIGIGV